MRSPCANTKKALRGSGHRNRSETFGIRVLRARRFMLRTLASRPSHVAPAVLMPEEGEFEGCSRHTALATGLKR